MNLLAHEALAVTFLQKSEQRSEQKSEPSSEDICIRSLEVEMERLHAQLEALQKFLKQQVNIFCSLG